MSVSLARVESSNLPYHQKSAIRRWYEEGGVTKTKGHVVEGGKTLRGVAEGALVGGGLGALNALVTGGLDYVVSPSIPAIPLDLGVCALSALGAITLANDGVATDLRNSAIASAAVFGFRKTDALVRTYQAKGGIHGEFGGERHEDPIVRAAQSL